MKIFQLRASRAVLNLGVRDIGNYIGVSGTAISSWESKDNLLDVSTSQQNVMMLEQFFMIKNIVFSDECTITLNEIMEQDNVTNSRSLTRFQLRGSRAILKLNRKDLASFAKTDKYVIARAEKLNNNEYIRPKDPYVSSRLKDIFIQHGLSFPTPLSISLNNKLP